MRDFLSKLAEAPWWAVSRVMARVWLRSCDSVGRNARTFFHPHIENRGRITIGNNVRLNSNWAPLELVTGKDGTIEIGDDVYINYGTLICAQRRVRVGKNVMIGNYSIIADTEIAGIDSPEHQLAVEPRPIDIGDGAWLAARVTVLPGAQIGAGTVIAAGSVVAGVIPAGMVAGGIPARVLRPLGDTASGDSPRREGGQPDGVARDSR